MPGIRWLALLISFVAPVAVGCGGGNGGGVGGLLGDDNGAVTFPALPSELLTAVCWRGNATFGDSVSGAVADNDCDAADFDPDGVGYFEVWRVRVASSMSVTFDVSSNFDSWLTLILLISFDPGTGELTIQILAENDDRSDQDLDALLTHSLQPERDYFIAVSGFDYPDTGSYTLHVR